MFHTPAVRIPISQGQSSYMDMAAPQNMEKEEDPSFQNVHGKLQEEMEKIVRWKASTEVSLNQKERQLNEAQRVIKVLRNNVVEQQLNSERLSQSLFREKNHREQILEQVTITRHLFDALRLRHTELETTVKEFQSLREHLKNEQDDAKTQIKSLNDRFEALALKHSKTIEEITCKANMELDFVSNERDELRYSLMQTENEVETLKSEIQLLQSVEHECGQKIFTLENRVESLTAKCNWTSSCLYKAKASVQSLTTKLEDSIISSEHLVSQLRQNFEEKCARLLESRNEFEEAAERVEYLTKCNEALQGHQDELTEQLQAAKIQKENLQKDLQETSEKYDELLNITSENESTLKKDKLALENDLKLCTFQLDEKIGENRELLKELEKASEELILINKKFEGEKVKLNEELERLIHENRTLLDSFLEVQKQARLSEEDNERERATSAELRNTICSLQENEALLEERKKNIQDELTTLSDNFERKSIALKEALEYQERVKESLEAHPKEIINLQEEIEKERYTCKDLKKTLNSKQKSLENEQKKNEKLENKLQTLQVKLSEKSKKSKEDHKAYAKTISELKEKVENFETQKDKLETMMDSLKKNSEESENSLKQQLGTANKAKETAEENAKDCLLKIQVTEIEAESKIKEVMDLTESWKRESEFVMREKDYEISELKKSLEGVEKSLAQTQEVQRALEDERKRQDEEILTLRDKLILKSSELNELKGAVKSLTDIGMGTSSTLNPPSTPDYLPPFDSSRSTEPKTGTKQSLRQSGILKSKSVRSLMKEPSKNVSFLSPVYKRADSDSSDGFTLDIGSDNDDQFEAIKRSLQIRHRSFDQIKSIPRANIHPIQRVPLNSLELQQPIENRQPATKRARFDRSSLRTYASPKENRIRPGNENKAPEESTDRKNTTNKRRAPPLASENEKKN